MYSYKTYCYIGTYNNNCSSSLLYQLRLASSLYEYGTCYLPTRADRASDAISIQILKKNINFYHSYFFHFENVLFSRKIKCCTKYLPILMHGRTSNYIVHIPTYLHLWVNKAFLYIFINIGRLPRKHLQVIFPYTYFF